MASLRLGHSLDTLRPSLTNGPGWRVSLWTQGCSLRCTQQCLNPHLLSSRGGWLVDVAEVVGLLATIQRDKGPVEGLTVLGGEPFDQPDALVELLESARAAGLSTMVYTGHVHEVLVRTGGPVVGRLLASVDLLVDGPFQHELYDEQLAWRGSRNQRLLCLTRRYRPAELERRYQAQRKAFSIQLTAGGRWSVSGLQERRAAEILRTALADPAVGHPHFAGALESVQVEPTKEPCPGAARGSS